MLVEAGLFSRAMFNVLSVGMIKASGAYRCNVLEQNQHYDSSAVTAIYFMNRIPSHFIRSCLPHLPHLSPSTYANASQTLGILHHGRECVCV